MTTERYRVSPSTALPGRFFVEDTVKGRVARNNSGTRAFTGMSQEDAAVVAERLNKNSARRKVCRGCRHLRAQEDVVGGLCKDCR